MRTADPTGQACSQPGSHDHHTPRTTPAPRVHVVPRPPVGSTMMHCMHAPPRRVSHKLATAGKAGRHVSHAQWNVGLRSCRSLWGVVLVAFLGFSEWSEGLSWSGPVCLGRGEERFGVSCHSCLLSCLVAYMSVWDIPTYLPIRGCG